MLSNDPIKNLLGLFCYLTCLWRDTEARPSRRKASKQSSEECSCWLSPVEPSLLCILRSVYSRTQIGTMYYAVGLLQLHSAYLAAIHLVVQMYIRWSFQ